MAKRRDEVLKALRSSAAPMSIVDLAQQLRLHPNTVRFHLRALAESGRVEQVEPSRTSPGRPPLMFRAHRGMDPAGPRNYQLLAEALAMRLGADNQSADKAIEAGRTWGENLAAGTPMAKAATNDARATDYLVGVLEDLGFSPQRRSMAGRVQIALRHCPFLELVPEHEAVICPVHLGLMQGVMGAMTTDSTVERLEPFAEPDLCVAHMSAAAAVS
jgi:predicted ArsR family transcriptional regulator